MNIVRREPASKRRETPIDRRRKRIEEQRRGLSALEVRAIELANQKLRPAPIASDVANVVAETIHDAKRLRYRKPRHSVCLWRTAGAR